MTDIGEFEVIRMDGYAIDELRVRVAVAGERID
jgi:hypothetical protein